MNLNRGTVIVDSETETKQSSSHGTLQSSDDGIVVAVTPTLRKALSPEIVIGRRKNEISSLTESNENKISQTPPKSETISEKLDEKEAKDYKKYLKELRDIASEQHTKMADAQDLIKKGREEMEIEAVIGLVEIGLTHDKIAIALKITVERVAEIVEDRSK